MSSARTGSPSRLLLVVAVVAVVYLLRAAQSLLIPIAIGVLVSYALEPLVAWLVRHRVPRVVASGLVVVTLSGVAGWSLYSLRDQFVAVTDALPDAARRLRELVLGSGSQATANIEQAVKELSSDAPVKPEGATNGSPTMTRATQSTQPPSARRARQAPPLDGATITVMLQTALGSLLTIAADATIVVFLAAFLLATGPSLRQHVVAAAGRREDREIVMRIVDDVNAQIQRFLLVRLLTAVLVGVATWAVLAWMQVEHAAVWGLLSGVFNSIPYFGPVIVSGGLVVVGLVQDGSLSRAVEMAGAALVITTLEGWLLTPFLLGKAERMNVIVVFLGVLIWSWIWGPWGTLLAVPMMVVGKSICDHVERLRPLSRLMGPLESSAE